MREQHFLYGNTIHTETVDLYFNINIIFFQTVDEITTHTERIWMPVHNPKPEEGLLIVNLGKNMDFWTGGRFKATLHRVVNKSGTVRHSVPFFYEPNMDAIIKENIDFTPMTTVYFLGLKSTSFKRVVNSYFLSLVI